MIHSIESQIDVFWPEMSRKYPGFEKPLLIPAAAISKVAPMYLNRYIDQDPTSYYMFLKGNPLNGDVSRENAIRFFSELLLQKMPGHSSYDVEAGGQYSQYNAIDKEILPAKNDSAFKNYYEEQMAKVAAEDAEAERQERIEKLGFDPDDGKTYDIDMSDDHAAMIDQAVSASRDVATSAGTAVGMPKQICYAVDVHIPTGGMLGYNGRAGRLANRRRAAIGMREADNDPVDIPKKSLNESFSDEQVRYWNSLIRERN